MVSNRIWEETDGAEKHRQMELIEQIKENKILVGLARCPVCGEKAKAVVFGYGEEGIWVGCDRSERCARNIEIHSEGWSLEETARDWNKRNRGIRLIIRRIKMLFERIFSRVYREERRINREREEEEAEKIRKMGEIFGIYIPPKRGFFSLFFRKTPKRVKG